MLFVDGFIDWCRIRNLRATTLESRRNTLRRVQGALGVPLEEATADQLRGWYEALYDRIQPEGCATALTHLRQFYRWLQLEGLRDDDPTVRLIRPRLARRLPRPIPDADLAVALADPPERVEPWLYLGCLAGLRAAEIAGLSRADLIEDAPNPTLFVRDGKGGKQRILPLHPTLAEKLRPWHRSGYLFRKQDGGVIPPHGVSHAVNAHLHGLGIASTLHCLRHWFGTKVYERTGDLRLTQELMGHSSPNTTAGYAAWNRARAHDAVFGLFASDRRAGTREGDPAGAARERWEGRHATPAGDLLVIGR